MKIIKLFFTIVTAFMLLNGCGGGGSTESVDVAIEVNGPAGEYAGATEFSDAMVSGQTVYNKLDDGSWGKLRFENDGLLNMWQDDGFSDTLMWEVIDGIISVQDGADSLPISLIQANETTWVIDSEGEGTVYLELKFTSQMLVGKRFAMTMEGIDAELEFTVDTIELYRDGEHLDTTPYRIENGTLITTREGIDQSINLMYIEGNMYRVWQPDNTTLLLTLIN